METKENRKLCRTSIALISLHEILFPPLMYEQNSSSILTYRGRVFSYRCFLLTAITRKTA